MSNDVKLKGVSEEMSKSIFLAMELRSTLCVLGAAMSGREDQTELNKSRPADSDIITVVEAAAERADALIELLDKIDCDHKRLAESVSTKAVQS